MNPQHSYYHSLPFHPYYSFYYPSTNPHFNPYWTYQLAYPMIPHSDSIQPNEQNAGASNIIAPYQINSNVYVKLQAVVENPPQVCRQMISHKGNKVNEAVSKEVASKRKEKSEKQEKKMIKMGAHLPEIKIEEVQMEKPRTMRTNQNIDITQTIIQIFESFHLHPDKYNSTINQTILNQVIEKEFISMIDQKIKSFRKSKEEMIKIVIRRTQKYYKTMYQCKRDGRFVKYGGFKSMNTVYLETMFSDPTFVQAFEEVAITFRDEYEEQNLKKMQTVCELVKNQKVKNEKDLLIQIISEKNKMPWPRCWINKMMKNIHWMYVNFSKEYLKEEIASELQRRCS